MKRLEIEYRRPWIFGMPSGSQRPGLFWEVKAPTAREKPQRQFKDRAPSGSAKTGLFSKCLRGLSRLSEALR